MYPAKLGKIIRDFPKPVGKTARTSLPFITIASTACRCSFSNDTNPNSCKEEETACSNMVKRNLRDDFRFIKPKHAHKNRNCTISAVKIPCPQSSPRRPTADRGARELWARDCSQRSFSVYRGAISKKTGRRNEGSSNWPAVMSKQSHDTNCDVLFAGGLDRWNLR